MSGLLPLGGGQTVTIQRRAVTSHDSDGNDVWTTTSVDVAGCVVYPRSSSELVQGVDTVIVGLTLLLPPGTTLTATDRVVVDGLTYEVDGQPGTWRNDLIGTVECVQAALTRITG